jgi:hypothetical protein
MEEVSMNELKNYEEETEETKKRPDLNWEVVAAQLHRSSMTRTQYKRQRRRQKILDSWDKVNKWKKVEKKKEKKK